jgi:hypothetical protein
VLRAYFFSAGAGTVTGALAVGVSAGFIASAGAGVAAAGGGVGAAAGGASFLPQAVSASAKSAETKSVRFILRGLEYFLTGFSDCVAHFEVTGRPNPARILAESGWFLRTVSGTAQASQA